MPLASSKIDDILTYWFGSADPAAAVDADMERWFRGGVSMDMDLDERFGATLDAMVEGRHDAWLQTPAGRLATVLVLDQFSRNIHRGTPRAFTQDDTALQIVLEGLDQGIDEGFGLHQRAFFYLPLEHSESPEMQVRSIERYTALTQVASTREEQRHAATYLDFARRHKAIIDRFGRYPHRNPILGRTTTTEEFSFMRQPGAGFG